MKKPEYYLEKHKLDQDNFEFNREELLEDLGDELSNLITEAIANNIDQAKNQTHVPNRITYPQFKQCIADIQATFNTLSETKANGPFTKGLWSAFFAKYIVKQRTLLFPELQDKILKLKQDNPNYK